MTTEVHTVHTCTDHSECEVVFSNDADTGNPIWESHAPNFTHPECRANVDYTGPGTLVGDVTVASFTDQRTVGGSPQGTELSSVEQCGICRPYFEDGIIPA